MSTEESQELVRRFFAEVLNKGDLTAVNQLFSPDFTLYYPYQTEGVQGPDAIAQVVAGRWRTPFPDFRILIEDEISFENRVVVRWTIQGTHKGPFDGPLGSISPTGRVIMLPGVSVFRIASGMIVEDRVSFDRLSLLQQLGAIPGSSY